MLEFFVKIEKNNLLKHSGHIYGHAYFCANMKPKPLSQNRVNNGRTRRCWVESFVT